MNTTMVQSELILTLGEVGGPPPEVVARAVAGAVLRDLVRYTPPAGLPQVRQAVADWLPTQAAVGPENVVMTCGASGGLLAYLMHRARPGSTILLPDPCYPAYIGLARRLGIETQFYPLAGGLDDIDAGVLADLITGRTLAVVVISPGNPTGRQIPVETVDEVARLAGERGVPLVVDEVYADLTGQQQVDPHRLWAAHRASIVLKSFSKCFALSGFRIGATIATADLVEPIAAAHFSAVMNAPTVGQLAALACLQTDTRDYLDDVRRRLRGRAAAAEAAFATVTGCEVGPIDLGVFAWVKVNDEPAAVVERLWSRHRIAVLDGASFGPSGREHLRIFIDIEPRSLDRTVTALRQEVRDG